MRALIVVLVLAAVLAFVPRRPVVRVAEAKPKPAAPVWQPGVSVVPTQGSGLPTYLGGPGNDRAFATCQTPDGGIIVVGSAQAGFPTTPGSAQPNYGGGTSDGFITKFSKDGSK